MIVLDASAAVDLLAGAPPYAPLVQRVSGQVLHAPHLIDLEVLNVLRRLATRHPGQAGLVEEARTDFHALSIVRYPHIALRERIWSLRGSMSAYDAAYVTLAEELDMPLVTTDARLGRASGSRCSIEVFEQPRA